MTDQPTPETDAIFTDNVPEDAQIVAFCERLERERDAARAERDELNRQLSVALKGKRPYSSEFADDTIAAQVKRIVELEEKLNGWFSERNAARADVALITDENERLATGNHSMEKEIPELRHALEKAFAERDEHIARNNDSLLALHLTTAERDEARADVARLSTALKGIVEYGKLCNPGTDTDCARLIYLAKQALTP
jgi:chromosome segregation ATPase